MQKQFGKPNNDGMWSRQLQNIFKYLQMNINDNLMPSA